MTTPPLLECVPNFSEGRDPVVIKQITDQIETVDGARLLDLQRVVWEVHVDETVREAALKAAMEEKARANVEGSLFYDATREATPASSEGLVRERKPCGLVV